MSTSLYLLSAEYQAAAQHLADMDLDDTTVADTLEGLAGELEVKATNIAMMIRNVEAEAEAIREAERGMERRRKTKEALTERLRAYLKENMERAGIPPIECPYFRISIRDNPPSVVIDAESQIPAEYMRQPPAVPDKKAIAAAIKEGHDIPGARVERGNRLEIR